MSPTTPTSDQLRDSILHDPFPQCHKTPKGAWVPRVSSILGLHPESLHYREHFGTPFSPWHQEFIERQSVIGNNVHDAIRSLLREEHFQGQLTGHEQSLMRKFRRWHRAYNPRILLPPDETITSESMGYAGTPDLVCKIGNNTVVVDYNVGVNRHLKLLQAEAYAALIEREKKIRVHEVAVLLLGGHPHYSTFIKERSLLQVQAIFHDCREQWNALFPDPSILMKKHEHALRTPLAG